MRREDLRNQGLTEEQINFVMQQNGIDIENAVPDSYVKNRAKLARILYLCYNTNC